MKIEITQEDHDALIELLNDMSDLRYDQAATLVGAPEAEDRYQYCLQQARDAARLLMELAKY